MKLLDNKGLTPGSESSACSVSPLRAKQGNATARGIPGKGGRASRLSGYEAELGWSITLSQAVICYWAPSNVLAQVELG